MHDAELLQKYVNSRDQAAFRALVDRYIGLVYSSARRQVHDAHLAEDIAQAVFITLAQKAKKIQPAAHLAGWLIAAARFHSRDAMKRENRRKHREHEAAASAPDCAPHDAARTWTEISPLVDDALSRLEEPDRSAVAMRYLQGKSLDDVGMMLGISTEAAQKRISRAIDRLRESFDRRGIMLSAEALTAAMAAQRVEAPPATLAESAAKAALAGKSSAIAMSLSAKLLALATAIVIVGGGVVAIVATTGHSATAPADNLIKVGILISQYNSVGPVWLDSRKPFGYRRASEALVAFKDPEIEQFAILEPATRRTGEIRALLARFRDDHIIDGTDAPALKKLDVIVSCFQWDVEPQVLNAIDQAVQSGTGLYFQATIGSFRPGYVNAVQDLQCIRHATRYYRYLDPTPVRVIKQHPLLADLKDLPDNTIVMDAVSGSIGEIQGTPLMECTSNNMLGEWGEREAQDTGTFDPPTTRPQAETFYPLFVGKLGKGNVVAVQWEDPGNDFRKLTKNRFPIHAVQWLAGRPIR